MKKMAFSRTPYIVVTAMALTALATNVLADRYENSNGVPADLYAEIQVVQQQIIDFQAYVEGNSSDVLDLSSAACFQVDLGLNAGLGLAAQGDIHAGIGTGVDIYGLLDIDAGAAIQAALDLGAQLGVGASGNISFCVNLGLLKVYEDGSVSSPFEGLGELGNARAARSIDDIDVEPLLALVEDTAFEAIDLIEEIPSLINSLEIGPLAVADGIDAIESFINNPQQVTDFINPANWDDVLAGLPGGGFVVDKANEVFATFDELQDGDLCGFLDDLGSVVSGQVGGALNTGCTFVANAGANGINFIANTVVTIYDNVSTVIGTISSVLGSVQGVVNSISGVVGSIQSTVGSILGKVNDILGALP